MRSQSGQKQKETESLNFKISAVFVAACAFLGLSFAIVSQDAYFAAEVIFYSGWALYCSAYLNPDLDQRSSFLGPSFDKGRKLKGYRAGYHHAPLKPLVEVLFSLKLNWIAMNIAKPIQKFLNILHNLYFSPLGWIFTHRGLLHWPVVGGFVKAAYATAPLWLLGIVPFEEVMTSKLVLVWVAADCGHILGDIIEDIRNGNSSFVPHQDIAPRGIVQTLLSAAAPKFLKSAWSASGLWRIFIV